MGGNAGISNFIKNVDFRSVEHLGELDMGGLFRVLPAGVVFIYPRLVDGRTINFTFYFLFFNLFLVFMCVLLDLSCFLKTLGYSKQNPETKLGAMT